MSSFHHPTPGFAIGILPLGLGFFLALLDVGDVTPFFSNLLSWLPLVSGVRAQMLRTLLGSGHDNLLQSWFKQLGVMPVGSVDDERQRDAIPVGEQAALPSIFFPCPWGWVPRTQWPAVLC